MSQNFGKKTTFHFQALAPEYEKAAAKSPIPLAKVDATIETELGKRFEIKVFQRYIMLFLTHSFKQIQGYPTLKFWKDSHGPVDYDGGRDEQGN